MGKTARPRHAHKDSQMFIYIMMTFRPTIFLLQRKPNIIQFALMAIDEAEITLSEKGFTLPKNLISRLRDRIKGIVCIKSTTPEEVSLAIDEALNRAALVANQALWRQTHDPWVIIHRGLVVAQFKNSDIMDLYLDSEMFQSGHPGPGNFLLHRFTKPRSKAKLTRKAK